jgi:hypothetical protein
MMPSPPPPVPAPAQQPGKKRIPTWVWVLTVGGVLFMIALYAAAFWGFRKIQDVARDEFAKANPEFEMLYFARDGQIKIRHRPSGRDFLVQPPSSRTGVRVDIQQLATRDVNPPPAWLQLENATPTATAGRWEAVGDTALLMEKMEDLLVERGFFPLPQDTRTTAACNAKTLECVTVQYGSIEGSSDRGWYSAQLRVTP